MGGGGIVLVVQGTLRLMITYMRGGREQHRQDHVLIQAVLLKTDDYLQYIGGGGGGAGNSTDSIIS